MSLLAKKKAVISAQREDKEEYLKATPKNNAKKMTGSNSAEELDMVGGVIRITIFVGTILLVGILAAAFKGLSLAALRHCWKNSKGIRDKIAMSLTGETSKVKRTSSSVVKVNREESSENPVTKQE